MNKKILISLSTIAAVAAITVGGTMALFSDTETSTGNIFTAGAIDLKVDHTRQTYNGVDCKTCSVDIMSDTTNQVVAQLGGLDPGPFPHPAVLVTNINPAWTANVPGASWIWWTNPTPEGEKGIDTTYTFRKTFTWMGPISGATLALATAADNGYEVRLNGNLIGSDPSEQNYNAAGQDLYTGFSAAIVQGTNTLEIKVKNMLRPAGQTWDNPGGLLYRLTINGNCGDAYFQNHCELWQSTDLTDEQFFSLDDVKPGDQGTNVISLSVTSNDAYACLSLNNKHDNDNGLVDPEQTAGDNDDGVDNGELSNYLNVVVWDDNAISNNGVHESGEEILYQGLLSGLTPQSLDLETAGTEYLGLAWCAGTQPPTADGDSGSIECDGSGDQNIAQTDSFVADVVATAVQQRNNETFVCPGSEPRDE